MKRHYKLLPLISLMIATPIVASLSSCTGIHSGTYQITLNSLKNQTPIKKLKHGPSLKSLLYGNKHFHKGNYVLFLSSQSAPGINKMLFGSSSTIFENKNAKIGENQNATLTAEVLQNINAQISSSWRGNKKIGKDVGYLWINCMDTKWEQKWFSDFYNYTGDNGPKTNNNEYYISPFAKWTENDEWHYKNDKGYKKAKSGKYIINTASAKSWRTLTTIDLPKLLNITDNNSFVMVQWIQGKKVTDSVNIANYNSDISQYDKVSNSTKFTDWVVNNYNQHQE